MKKTRLFFFFFILNVAAFSQSISPEQENAIYELSKKSAKIMSDNILMNFVKFPYSSNEINIRIFPAENANGMVTDFGTHFSRMLETNLQSKLNSAIIKRFDYKIVPSTNSNFEQISNNFDLSLSYFLKDSLLTISKADLTSIDKKISLKPFSVSGNIDELFSFNSISDNANYDQIIAINEDNKLFETLIISDENGEIFSKNNIYELKRNKNYDFRIKLIPKTYLYVFYYEPVKSSFYVIYPNIPQNNKQITYNIKDIKNMSFSNVDEAKLKIVISGNILKINEMLNHSGSEISPDKAEILLKEMQKNSGNLSTKDFELKF